MRFPRDVWYHDIRQLQPISEFAEDNGLETGKNADSMETGVADGQRYFVKEGPGVVASHLVAGAVLPHLDVATPDIHHDPDFGKILLSEVAEHATGPRNLARTTDGLPDIDRGMYHDAVAVELFLGLPDPTDNTTVTPDGEVYAVDFDQAGYASIRDIDVDGYLETVDEAFAPFDVSLSRPAISGRLEEYAEQMEPLMDDALALRWYDANRAMLRQADPYWANVERTVETLRR